MTARIAPSGYRYTSHPRDAFARGIMPWSDVPANRPVVRERCATPGCDGRTPKAAADHPHLAVLCQPCRTRAAFVLRPRSTTGRDVGPTRRCA